ncbi:MAG: hypothetical protein KHY22_03980 [Sutterella wadsworthensis]|nr:hypothetical protein [Sutterella wadsworthensis]
MLNQGMMLMKGGNAYPKNRPIPWNQFVEVDVRIRGELFDFSWFGRVQGTNHEQSIKGIGGLDAVGFEAEDVGPKIWVACLETKSVGFFERESGTSGGKANYVSYDPDGSFVGLRSHGFHLFFSIFELTSFTVV